MGSEFHKGKRFIQEVLKVVQAGLAENATPEDRETMAPVSYTHLDVYKRQLQYMVQTVVENQMSWKHCILWQQKCYARCMQQEITRNVFFFRKNY